MKLNHKLSDVIIKGLHQSDVENIYFLLKYKRDPVGEWHSEPPGDP